MISRDYCSIRWKITIGICLSLFSGACTQTQTTPPTVPVVIVPFTPKPLPPTWTHTVEPTDAITGTMAATRTLLPVATSTWTPWILPTQTPSRTPIPSPTRGPWVTPTYPRNTNCNVVAVEDGVELYDAPQINPWRVWPTLEPGVEYMAVSVYPTYYELVLNGRFFGYVDFRLLAVDLVGSGCSRLPTDHRPITEFSTLCFFFSDETIPTYRDAKLQEELSDIGAGFPNVVARIMPLSYHIIGGHAMTYYVDKSAGDISGACHLVPVVTE